ncbi:MAG: hypothetical protein BWY91_03350 [bacterium ADurb.BinA028]|nr:MAG: hypothetical protein BWY91_03350 [bacterium ADurb.BinA028]
MSLEGSVSSLSAVPVFTIAPASISACVTVYVPVSTHVPPGATKGQFALEGVSIGSLTTTFVSVTFPVFVIVTVYVSTLPTTIGSGASVSALSTLNDALCTAGTVASSASVAVCGMPVPSVYVPVAVAILVKLPASKSDCVTV